MAEPALRETFGNFLVETGNKYKDMVVLDADLSLLQGHINLLKHTQIDFSIWVSQNKIC